jgi:uncharacterized delta-60 repeat protein
MKTRAFLLMSFIYLAGFSQDGSPDLAFGDNGITRTNYGETLFLFHSLNQGSTGRIALSGIMYHISEQDVFLNVYNADGSFDSSFGNNGTISFPENDFNHFGNIQVLNSSKLLYHSTDGNLFTINRMLPDGSPDIAFGNDGSLVVFSPGVGNNYYLNSDESFYVIGVADISTSPKMVLKKILSNGETDITFNSDGMIEYPIGDLLSIGMRPLQTLPNGNIILNYVIRENTSGIVYTNYIVRFLANGELDLSYGTNGSTIIPIDSDFQAEINSFDDGSVLASYSYYDAQNEVVIRKTLKLNSNGELDTSFANSGYLDGYQVQFIQENQRFIALSGSPDWEGGFIPELTRFFQGGTLDFSFSFQFNHTEVSSFLIRPTQSGKILFAGDDVWYNGPQINLVMAQYNNSPLSIHEQSIQNLNIFPNPSEGIFTIGITANLDSEIDYQVLDATARIIKTGVLTEASPQIDLSEANSGIYFLITSNDIIRLLKK